jgi:carboxyl-terminal processing protease
MSRKRNILLFAAALLIAPRPQGWTEQKPEPSVKLNVVQNLAVIQAAWQHVDDLFYDPNFRGVNWAQVRAEYRQRASSVETSEQLKSLIRQMLSTLHNSHIGVMTHEEYARTRYVLPFFSTRSQAECL